MIKPIPLVDSSSRQPLSEVEAERLEDILGTIADRTRLHILGIVLRSNGEPVCTCNLVPELGLSQPTVSYHLKQLVQAGLLEREPRGAFAFYRLVPGALEDVAAFVGALDEVGRKGASGE
jgi:ArsR family transcriptional regulator